MAVFVCGLVVEQGGELFDFIFIDRWITVKSESLAIQSTSRQGQHQAVWSHDGFNVPPALVCQGNGHCARVGNARHARFGGHTNEFAVFDVFEKLFKLLLGRAHIEFENI